MDIYVRDNLLFSSHPDNDVKTFSRYDNSTAKSSSKDVTWLDTKTLAGIQKAYKPANCRQIGRAAAITIDIFAQCCIRMAFVNENVRQLFQFFRVQMAYTAQWMLNNA